MPVIKLHRTKKDDIMDYIKEMPEPYFDQIVLVGFPKNLQDTDNCAMCVSNFTSTKDEILAVDYLLGHMQDQFYSIDED